MARVVSWNVHGFTIESHGNGLAYSVERDSDKVGFFLQGESADYWRAEYDAADSAPDPATLAQFLHQSISDYSQGPDF